MEANIEVQCDTPNPCLPEVGCPMWQPVCVQLRQLEKREKRDQAMREEVRTVVSFTLGPRHALLFSQLPQCGPLAQATC